MSEVEAVVYSFAVCQAPLVVVFVVGAVEVAGGSVVDGMNFVVLGAGADASRAEHYHSDQNDSQEETHKNHQDDDAIYSCLCLCLDKST